MKPAAWKFLKSSVAIKIIVGHIRQTVTEHRIKMISKSGVSGVISPLSQVNDRLFKKSRIQS